MVKLCSLRGLCGKPARALCVCVCVCVVPLLRQPNTILHYTQVMIRQCQ